MQAKASSSDERAGAVNAGRAGALLAIWTAVVTIAFREHGARFVSAPALVLRHVTRFVGLYFLFLSSRGMLPRAFAIPAASGDIAIDAGALLLAAFWVPPHTALRRGALYLWNAPGLADILFVVGSAAWLTRGYVRSSRRLICCS